MRFERQQRQLIVSILVPLISTTLILLLDAAPGVYIDWHRTPNIGGSYQNRYQPVNEGFEQNDIQSSEFRSGFLQLRNIVDEAVTDQKQLRAYGSKWSTTNIPYTDEYVVESWGLNYCQIGISNEQTVVSGERAGRLVFVQAGVMIKHLNQALLEAGLALSTTGSGDGQRIVGATTTGTHGAANSFGPMTEFVKAIHIVLAGGEHVVLQRQSDPVVSGRFVNWIGEGGGRLINSDEMFSAAAVGLGSFGLVHALIIEAEPLYQLRCQIHQRSYSSIRTALNTLDVSDLDLQVGNGASAPYHFTILLNPYQLGGSPRGAFVEACEKVPSADSSTISDPEKVTLSPVLTTTPIRSTRSIEGFVNDFIPDDCHLFGVCSGLKRHVFGNTLQSRLESFRQPYNAPKTKFPSEWFTFEGSDSELSEGRSNTNAEVAVPLSRTVDTLEVIFGVFEESPLMSNLEIRFVRQSQALLAPSQYGDVTTTIAMSAPVNDDVFSKLERVFEGMERSGIPHAYHWGKYHPQNSMWVAQAFGERYEEWQRQRRILLNTDVLRQTFTNDWLITLGMA